MDGMRKAFITCHQGNEMQAAKYHFPLARSELGTIKAKRDRQ